MFWHPPPHFSFLSVSRPDKVFFPPVNWKVTKNYEVEQDVGPAVEHIYEVISHVLSCADSRGGWADRVGKQILPFIKQVCKPKKMYSRLRRVSYSQAAPVHFHLGEIEQSSSLGELFVGNVSNMKVSAWKWSGCSRKSSNASHTKVSYLISLFSSWWTTGPVGSATPYLSCLAPSASRVTISSTPWSSPPKDPSTAPQTKTWTTCTSK